MDFITAWSHIKRGALKLAVIKIRNKIKHYNSAANVVKDAKHVHGHAKIFFNIFGKVF